MGWGGGEGELCCQLASYIMFNIDGLNCFYGVKGAAWVGNGTVALQYGRRY